jgi:hypothetical protein
MGGADALELQGFEALSEKTRQLAAQLREKAEAAEQRALSADRPAERALYRAEAVNYQSLAVEVEKLAQAARHIDATSAAVIEKIGPQEHAVDDETAQ